MFQKVTWPLIGRYTHQLCCKFLSSNRCLVLLLLSFLLIGCGAHRVIRTDPPGATISVDDEKIGSAPVTYAFSTSGFRFNYKVRAEMKGYHTAEELVRPYTDFWGTISWPDVFITLRKIEKEAEEKNKYIILRNDSKSLSPSELIQATANDTAKEKLKFAFENKKITVEQLKKANIELQSQNYSRTLRAFIDGSIDEETFGSLY